MNHTRTTGTHTGELFGIPPTGKRISIDHVEIWRIEGDKIVEHWGGTSELEHVIARAHEATDRHSVNNPVIIEVALNGVTSPQPQCARARDRRAQAKDALACIDAGATIIHTHAPDLVVDADAAAEQYADAFRPVVEQHPGVVCYPTVGFGPTIEERYRHVELLDDMGLARQGASTPAR